MGINDRAQELRVAQAKASAEAAAQRAQAAREVSIRAAEQARIQELLKRYISWLINANVPPTGTGTYAPDRKERRRGAKGRSWSQGDSRSWTSEDNTETQVIWNLTVWDNGKYDPVGVSMEHLREAISRTVAHSLSKGGPAWPYDD